MSKSMFASLLKNVPAAASIAVEGTSSAEFSGWIDTGSYVLNASLSGSLFGGIADNKITVFAGESSTGKTFFVLGILTKWMQENPTGVVVYFDTESAVTNKMLEDHSLDTNRVLKVEPDTIEQFRESALAILDNYEKGGKSTPMIMVLDSLGNLSSRKEITDIRDQKDSRDMTKAQLIRGTFRVLRLMMSKLAVPMIVANHTYQVVGCLSAGIGVLLSSRDIKRIEDIVVGDEVETLDGPKLVTETFQYDEQPVIDITFEDGTVVSATPNHKFLTVDGRWVRADELLETDEIQVGLVS